MTDDASSSSAFFANRGFVSKHWNVLMLKHGGRVAIYERSCATERRARERCAELARVGVISYASRTLPPGWFY